MRLTWAILMAILLWTDLASAQGVKDPANYGQTTTSRQTPSQATRPTAIQNIPTSSLRNGAAVQQTYRNGKLVPYVR